MAAMVRAIELINRCCGAVSAALVLVLMGLMVYEVVMRYVFAAPTAWSYDLSTMAMGAVFVLSIGYGLATGSHVRVDVLRPWFGRRGPMVIDLAGHALVMLPLLVWLAIGLWDHVHGAFVTQERSGTSAWNPLVWPFRAVMFVGIVVWALQVAAEIVKAGFALAGRPLAADD